MTTDDVSDLKIAAQQAILNGSTLMQLPVAQVSRLIAEAELRTTAYCQLLESVRPVRETVTKWRSGEIGTDAAMKAIGVAFGAWDRGQS